MKLAVVLFNLGGPATLGDIEPFLRNLFSDPAILSLPAPLRHWLAGFIAKKRTPTAREIYSAIGGGSPILPQTQMQANALEKALGDDCRVFIAMRYTRPRAMDVVQDVMAYGPERIVLLPLYPHYSKTTTGSSLLEWQAEAVRAGLTVPTEVIQSYPVHRGFVAALGDLVGAALKDRKTGISYRVLFSAHGLPERVIKSGDPYADHILQTAEAVAEYAGIEDWQVCYQSKVGPLKWIGPPTLDEIKRAGAEGKAVIIVPLAFVSEHSETLYELDIEYRHLADTFKVPDYIRVPTVGTHPAFISGLADLVRAASGQTHPICGQVE